MIKELAQTDHRRLEKAKPSTVVLCAAQRLGGAAQTQNLEKDMRRYRGRDPIVSGSCICGAVLAHRTAYRTTAKLYAWEMDRIYWVYVLASRKDGALYVGVTSDLARRVELHRSGRGSQYVNRFQVHRLVLAEPYPTAEEAIAREKQIKSWRRAWKLDLIEKANPDWDDLYASIV